MRSRNVVIHRHRMNPIREKHGAGKFDNRTLRLAEVTNPCIIGSIDSPIIMTLKLLTEQLLCQELVDKAGLMGVAHMS